MARKLVLASIGLIAVGLVLLVMSNTYLVFLTRTGGSPTAFGTFPARSGNFTGFSGNFTFTRIGGSFARGGTSLTAIESIVGLGLVGGGLLLEVFSVLIRAAQPGK